MTVEPTMRSTKCEPGANWTPPGPLATYARLVATAALLGRDGRAERVDHDEAVVRIVGQRRPGRTIRGAAASSGPSGGRYGLVASTAWQPDAAPSAPIDRPLRRRGGVADRRRATSRAAGRSVAGARRAQAPAATSAAARAAAAARRVIRGPGERAARP